jgi:hypothetical protein
MPEAIPPEPGGSDASTRRDARSSHCRPPSPPPRARQSTALPGRHEITPGRKWVGVIPGDFVCAILAPREGRSEKPVLHQHRPPAWSATATLKRSQCPSAYLQDSTDPSDPSTASPNARMNGPGTLDDCGRRRRDLGRKPWARVPSTHLAITRLPHGLLRAAARLHACELTSDRCPPTSASGRHGGSSLDQVEHHALRAGPSAASGGVGEVQSVRARPAGRVTGNDVTVIVRLETYVGRRLRHAPRGDLWAHELSGAATSYLLVPGFFVVLTDATVTGSEYAEHLLRSPSGARSIRAGDYRASGGPRAPPERPAAVGRVRRTTESPKLHRAAVGEVCHTIGPDALDHQKKKHPADRGEGPRRSGSGARPREAPRDSASVALPGRPSRFEHVERRLRIDVGFLGARPWKPRASNVAVASEV